MPSRSPAFHRALPFALCGLLLTGCDDQEPAAEEAAEEAATEEDASAESAPVRIEPPEPPYGGAVDPDGKTLRCLGRRFSMTKPWWFAFSDKDSAEINCPSGNSTSVLHTVPVTGHTGTCTVGWSGGLREGAEYRFAGVGAQLAWADLSSYSAVTLMTRGDGQKYRMELISDAFTTTDEGCEDPDWDFHGAPFRCGDGSENWKPVTISFRRMRQEGWGTLRELDLTGVDRVHVRTWAGSEGDFACDFWIQSVTLKSGDIMPFQ